MSPQKHIERHVHSAQMFDVQNANEDELQAQINDTLRAGVRWAIVMPAEGIIVVNTSDDAPHEYFCSRGQGSRRIAITSTLQNIGFFTEDAPPVVVPQELTVARSGENPQYMVSIPLNEMKTVYHLIR